MSKLKYLINYLLIIITIINTYLLYYFGEATIVSTVSQNLFIASKSILTILTLVIIGLLLFVESSSIKRFLKKNVLRLALIMNLLLIFFSISQRLTENLGNEFLIWRWSNTVLFLSIFLINSMIAYDLFETLKKISNKN